MEKSNKNPSKLFNCFLTEHSNLSLRNVTVIIKVYLNINLKVIIFFYTRLFHMLFPLLLRYYNINHNIFACDENKMYRKPITTENSRVPIGDAKKKKKI